MAMSDEVRANPRYKQPQKKKKEKKGFVESFIPLKGDSSSVIVSKVIVLAAIAILIACAIILGIYFYHIFEAKQNQKELSNTYNIFNNLSNQGQSGEAVETVPPIEITDDGEIIRNPLVDMPFAVEMLKINGDYAGYVSIPGVMSEAVVQADDNEYYLKKNIYGQNRSCGTVYADYRNVVNDYSDRQSDNIILYGHNQRDGTMFGQMDFYKWDAKYWLQNPYIYFDNRYEQSTYVIIASFVINTEPEHDNGNVFDYHNYINFTEDHPFETFMKEINERSHFHTGIDVNENDKFITLSTCSYEWEPARHVIIARKLRADETTENLDTTGFAVNTNPKWPAVYYKYNGGTYVE
ncbi:MAG: class B sortase [Oscillospiraceae bacterium]|nr:class B sortase [Oscillospiraceae bacterium]